MVSELKHFHPLVARWLDTNGYAFEHEVNMPEYGRADFVAKHKETKETLIVECKTNASARDGRSIIQLLDYCRQMPECKPAYAIPKATHTEYIANLCNSYNVRLICVSVPQNPVELEELIAPYLSVATEENVDLDVSREARYEAMREQIKQIARRQMAEGGTNSVSLRGIAREMELTAPALYRYFPRMDDLITGLILDAYNDQADALKAARDQTAGQSTAERLMAAALAYRGWALEHRTDFQLIYGNPIPGYVAPAEITMPAARRGLEVFVDLIMDGVQAGEIIPPQDLIPPELVPHLESVRAAEGYPIPLEVLYMAVVGWPRMHGIVMLEVFDHIQPLVGDAAVFYRDQVCALFRELGLKS